MKTKYTLEEIKTKLNNPEYSEWNDFINTYDFDDDYDDFYLDYILEFQNMNEFFLSSIVDLTGFLGFYNQDLFKKYFNYLVNHKGFFVKDSVLHYIRKGNIYYEDNVINMLNSYLKFNIPLIERNGIILKMIIFTIFIKYYQLKEDKELESFYCLQYLKTLNKCRSWKSVYRAYTDAIEFDSLLIIKSSIIEICKKKNLQYSLGISYNDVYINDA